MCGECVRAMAIEDGDSNGGVSSNGGYVDHGWQKVTNAKKQKRQESKAKGGKEAEKGATKSSSSDSKLFQALEEEAADRRARREARIQAALAGDVHSEDDSDAENEKPVQADEAEVKKPKVKKPKKPKVTVPEAAAAIDLSDLSTFLSDISVCRFFNLDSVQGFCVSLARVSSLKVNLDAFRAPALSTLSTYGESDEECCYL